MPYKDPEKQKAAQRKSYLLNKEAIQKKRNAKRKEIGSYKRDRIQKLAAWVQELKESKPCADCRRSFHYCAMDYDHVRGDKVANVSVLVAYGYSRRAILDEIAKCDLVCAVCHRIREFERKSWQKNMPV